MANTHPDRRRAGELRFRKEVNGLGANFRGYDRIGIRDIFVYFNDEAAMRQIISALG